MEIPTIDSQENIKKILKAVLVFLFCLPSALPASLLSFEELELFVPFRSEMARVFLNSIAPHNTNLSIVRCIVQKKLRNRKNILQALRLLGKEACPNSDSFEMGVLEILGCSLSIYSIDPSEAVVDSRAQLKEFFFREMAFSKCLEDARDLVRNNQNKSLPYFIYGSLLYIKSLDIISLRTLQEGAGMILIDDPEIERSNLVQKALQQFDQAIKITPTFINAYLAKAMILFENGDNKQALEICHKLESDFSSIESFRAFFLESQIYTKEKKLDEARKSLDQFILICPSEIWWDAFLRRSDVDEYMGKLDERRCDKAFADALGKGNVYKSVVFYFLMDFAFFSVRGFPYQCFIGFPTFFELWKYY